MEQNIEDILFVRQREQQPEEITKKMDVLAIGFIVIWVLCFLSFVSLPFILGGIWPWDC